MSHEYNSRYYDGTHLAQLRPRLTAFKTYVTKDGTLIGLFQGSRGARPDIDFVVKILVPGVNKIMTPPTHTFWVVDLLLKIPQYRKDVREIVQYYIDFYERTTPFAQVFGVEEKDVTKEMRRQAKVINFGILYGMGVNALKANLGSTQAEARAFYDNYFKTFKGVAEYLNKVKFETAQNGYTETLFGRRRYFEGINSKLPFIRAAAERMAINAPIQGTSADMVKIAMRVVQAKLAALGMIKDVRLLLQVHDELVFEIRTPEVKKMSIMIKQTMESVLTPEQSKGVPIVTSANAGKNWNKLEALEL